MDSTSGTPIVSEYIAFPKSTPPPPREDTPLAVLVGHQVIYFASTDKMGASGPQCVAEHKKKRCTNGVNAHEHGCLGHHEGYDIDGMHAKVHVYVPHSVDHFVQQQCVQHLDSDAPNVIEPTWSLFDPAKHADVMRHHNPKKWTNAGLRADAVTEVAPPTPVRPPESLFRDRPTRDDVPLATALYTVHDDAGRLLYIGITNDLPARLAAHGKASAWWDFMATFGAEWFPNRREAEAEEQARIGAGRPVFNVVHNDYPERVPTLVQYVVDRGRLDLFRQDIKLV